MRNQSLVIDAYVVRDVKLLEEEGYDPRYGTDRSILKFFRKLANAMHIWVELIEVLL